MRKQKSRAATRQSGWSSKKVLSTQVSPDLLEALRDCVVALSGPPERLTVSAFVENAIRRELQRLRRKENAGKPFRRRKAGVRVRSGRPVAS